MSKVIVMPEMVVMPVDMLEVTMAAHPDAVCVTMLVAIREMRAAMTHIVTHVVSHGGFLDDRMLAGSGRGLCGCAVGECTGRQDRKGCGESDNKLAHWFSSWGRVAAMRPHVLGPWRTFYRTGGERSLTDAFRGRLAERHFSA